MPIDQQPVSSASATPSEQTTPALQTQSERPTKRLNRWAFYIFALTLILAPLAFWPSAYIPLELVKTIIISVGALVSAILCVRVVIKERKLVLPPKTFFWIGSLIALSLVISSFASGHFSASFFGQGFEVDTASFILILLLSGLVAWTVVIRKKERVMDAYVVIVCSFLVITVFQGLRLLFGQGFASLGILTSITSTIFGNWYSFGIGSFVVLIIAISALIFLELPRNMKIVYWIVAAVSFLVTLFIDAPFAWAVAALVFFGMALYAFFLKKQTKDDMTISAARRIPWTLCILFLLSLLLAWRGPSLIGPAISRMGISYSELSLPWQMTLDVATGALKDQPLLGAGPNRFSEAYLTHKPDGINLTNAWNVNFNSGVSLFSTFIVTQGLIGTVLWILAFIFIGIFGARMLRRMPREPQARFLLVSSYSLTVFLWLISIIYVPSHVILLYIFVATGMWLGASSAYDCFKPWSLSLQKKRLDRALMLGVVVIILLVIWGIWCVKDTAALTYYGTGAKELTALNDPISADASFKQAFSFNDSDVYMQAQATAELALANQLLGEQSSASTTVSASQALVARVSAALNQAISDAAHAVAIDPTDYANYVSEAQVFAQAAGLNVPNAYQNAVQAYTKAIQLDPQDPSLYLTLAQLEASDKDYGNALKATGAALQVKSNYPDAAFLLTQIEAAQGNLTDAITAAQFDTEIDPSNPLTFFQLGLLYYDNQQFSSASQAFASAIALQSGYANAEYFLGLSDARLGNTSGAIAEFEQLAASNPGNQSVTAILAALRSGKSIFAAAASSSTPSLNVRGKLPIEQSR